MPEDGQVQGGGGEWHIEEEKSNFIETADGDREIIKKLKKTKQSTKDARKLDTNYK